MLLADQTAVDLIAIGDFAEDELPEDLPERVFVLGHDYAITTAQPVTLQARRGSRVVEEATTPFATAAALVACKSAAAFGRRGAAAPSKRASDVLDLYRLLTAHDVAEQLRAAPHGLGGCVAVLLERLLVQGADRCARDLRSLGVVAVGITADALESVGVTVSTALR